MASNLIIESEDLLSQEYMPSLYELLPDFFPQSENRMMQIYEESEDFTSLESMPSKKDHLIPELSPQLGHMKALCKGRETKYTMKEESQDLTSFSSATCQEVFPQLGGLNVHWETLKDSEQFNSGKCQVSFFKKDLFKAHMQIHTNEEIFEYEVCPTGFSDSSYLNRQIKMPKAKCKTSKSGYKDPQNAVDKLEASKDKSSTASSSQDQVNKGEGGTVTNAPIPALQQTFECDVCEKMFINPSELKKHMLVNTGVKPFQCKVCGKGFKHSYHLKTHILTHTGEKPFKCVHCDKEFSQKGDLVRHIRVHTGEKPFECIHCDKGFSKKSHLTAHERTHTGEKPFKCKHCDKRFSDGSNLKRHMKRFHKDI